MLATEQQCRQAIHRHLGARDSLVAPGFTADCPRRWEGRLQKKPWDYQVTVAIPHLEKPYPFFREILDLYLLQSEPPYIMIIDTGSARCYHDALERLRSPQV